MKKIIGNDKPERKYEDPQFYHDGTPVEDFPMIPPDGETIPLTDEDRNLPDNDK